MLEYIADVDRQAVQLFDLWEYNSYVGAVSSSMMPPKTGLSV